MNCKDIRPLLSQLVDGELDKINKAKVESHLNDCRECKQWLEQLKSLNQIYAAKTAPAALKAQVLGKVNAENHKGWKSRFAGFFEGKKLASIGSLAIAFVAVLMGVGFFISTYRGQESFQSISALRDEQPQLPPANPPVQPGEVLKPKKLKLAVGGSYSLLKKSYPSDILANRPLSGSNKSAIKSTIQKIIKTANIEIKIKRKTAKEKLEAVMRIAEVAEGYVVDSDLSKGSVSADATAVIRVPEQALKDVVAKLSELGKVNKFTQSGQDVTNEYVDLQARIKQLKAEEMAFRRLYERASKIPDLLDIQSRLSDVQTQVEQLQAQLNQLGEQVNFATINVKLTEPKVRKPLSFYKIWADNKAIEKGLAGFFGLASFITIGFITVLPIAMVAIAVWLISHFVKRRR
jgi:hypothetical protein